MSISSVTAVPVDTNNNLYHYLRGPVKIDDNLKITHTSELKEWLSAFIKETTSEYRLKGVGESLQKIRADLSPLPDRPLKDEEVREYIGKIFKTVAREGLFSFYVDCSSELAEKLTPFLRRLLFNATRVHEDVLEMRGRIRGGSYRINNLFQDLCLQAVKEKDISHAAELAFLIGTVEQQPLYFSKICNALLDQGKDAEAIELMQALYLIPHDLYTCHWEEDTSRAVCLVFLEKRGFEVAANLARKLAKDESDIGALRQLSLSLAEKGDVERAEQLAREICEKLGYWEAKTVAAICQELNRQEKWEQAHKLAAEMSQKNPARSSLVSRALISGLLARKEISQAILLVRERFNQEIQWDSKIDKDDLSNAYLICRSLIEDKKIEEAISLKNLWFSHDNDPTKLYQNLIEKDICHSLGLKSLQEGRVEDAINIAKSYSQEFGPCDPLITSICQTLINKAQDVSPAIQLIDEISVKYQERFKEEFKDSILIKLINYFLLEKRDFNLGKRLVDLITNKGRTSEENIISICQHLIDEEEASSSAISWVEGICKDRRVREFGTAGMICARLSLIYLTKGNFDTGRKFFNMIRIDENKRFPTVVKVLKDCQNLIEKERERQMATSDFKGTV